MPTSRFFTTNTSLRDAGLTLLRVITGVTFMAHGYQKLFTFGIAGVQDGFTKMGAPLPTVTAPLVAGLEFFGGLALVLGLLTRIVALGLAMTMFGAIVLVHLAAGFFAPNGYEFVLVLMTASLVFALGGAGPFSVDELIARRAVARPA